VCRGIFEICDASELILEICDASSSFVGGFSNLGFRVLPFCRRVLSSSGEWPMLRLTHGVRVLPFGGRPASEPLLVLGWLCPLL
jgi:hypothetical protein